MQVYRDFRNLKRNENTFLTIGTFDGIHIGHKKIIDALRDKALSNGGRSLVITFNPHPKNVLSNTKARVLTSLREKEAILSELGVEDLIVINFTKEFSQINAGDFLKNILVDKVGVKEIFIGYDHHFGKGREGNKDVLVSTGKELGFKVTEVAPEKINNETISSTLIRDYLEKGSIDKVNSFLGRSYTFSGTVVEGDKRGRTLGFPTANIDLEDEDKLLPAFGVYVVEFFVRGEKHYGLLSVGRRPTFYNFGTIIPEVYIYDFDDDIYGEFVTVNVLGRLRGEEKFSSVEELIEQMHKDKADGSEFLLKFRK